MLQMPLPAQQNGIKLLAKGVGVLAYLCVGGLSLLLLGSMFGFFADGRSVTGITITPDWVGTCACALGYALGACVLLVMLVAPFGYAYYTVPGTPAGGWTFWKVESGHLVPAAARRHWFEDKNALIAIQPTMSCYAYFGTGNSFIHYFRYSVQFTAELNRETAISFYNWWCKLPAHRQDATGMEKYLKDANERDDLPFKVAILN